MAEKKLVRSSSNKMIAGVCAGLADYLGLDVSLVRIAFALLVLMSGIGAPIYLVMWFIMPEEPTVAGVDTTPDTGLG